MHDFQKKKRTRKILYSPFTLVFLTGVLILLASGVWGVYKKNELSIENFEKEKMELAKLTARQKNLASSIEYLKTEQGIENEIRTKFRAVKEGEQVAVIIDNEQIASQTPPSSPKRSKWSAVFHWPQ